MRKLLSKFKVMVPMLVCLLAFTMVLFTGCEEEHVHDLSKVAGTEATCTTAGVKEHWHCKTCEKDFLTETAEQEATATDLEVAINDNHNYDFENASYNFQKSEEGTWTCTANVKCLYNEAHTKSENATTVTCDETTHAPTCTKDGTRILTATFEDTMYGNNGVVTKEETMPRIAHSIEKVEAKAPTCTANGNIEYYHCSMCDGNFKDEQATEAEKKVEVLATGHTKTHHEKQEATCTTTGIKEYWSCSACNKNFSDEECKTEITDLEISAKGHKYTFSTPKYSTSKNGETYQCTAKVKCENCEYEETETVNAKSTQVTTQPTCTTDGSIKLAFAFTKTNVGFTTSYETTYRLDKLGHSMTHIQAVSATCESNGNVEHYQCSRCNKNFSDEAGTTEIENVATTATGHNYTYAYDYTTRTYTGTCKNDNSHTTTETAGTEAYPYLVKDETTLKEAIALGGYVKIADDVTNIDVDEKISVTKALVLNLNGKKISYSTTSGRTPLFDVGNVNFVLTNGELIYSSKETDTQLINFTGSTAMLENVTLTSTRRGVQVYGDTTLTIKNSTMNTGFAGVGGDNTQGATKENGLNVVIDNSILTSTDATAIFMPSLMNVTIKNNSQITGNTSAVYAMMGTLNVDATSTLACTATTFNARTAENVWKNGYPDSSEFESTYGGQADGATIVIRSNYYYNETSRDVYSVGNKLVLNIANWNNVTSASGKKAVIYNWITDSSHISAVKNKNESLAEGETSLEITDQFKEVLAKLADKDGVLFYTYNGTEVSTYTVNKQTVSETEA